MNIDLLFSWSLSMTSSIILNINLNIIGLDLHISKQVK